MDLSWTVTADKDGKPAYGFLAIYGKDKAKVESATKNDKDLRNAANDVIDIIGIFRIFTVHPTVSANARKRL